MTTQDFAAALDTAGVEIDYALESDYTKTISGTYRRVRLTSEEFASTKTRTRPAEINADGQASQALTTQVEATGSLGFGLSARTYDDFLVAAVNGAPFATRVQSDGSAYAVATSGSGGLRFTRTGGTSHITRGFTVGSYVRTKGFVNAANNGVFRIVAVTANQVDCEASGATVVAETAASGATLDQGGRTRNGVVINTLSMVKNLGNDSGGSPLLLHYPGSYINEMTLDVAIGGFVSGSFEFLASEERKLTAHPGAGSVTAAPTGRIIDTVSGVKDFSYDDDALDGDTFDTILQSLSLTVSKEGARSQYGIGNSKAQGIGRGTLSVSGDFSTYFRNFALYDKFVSEDGSIFHVVLRDDLGAGYVLSFPNITLVNPSITAGGPDTDLVAEFELEGNPGRFETTTDNPFTIQIDRVYA